MLYEDPELYDALLPASRDHVQFYDQLAGVHGGPVLELPRCCRQRASVRLQ